MPATGSITKLKVLYICLGNSCRSIMAEALTRHLCGNKWEAASAGLNPLGFVARETETVLKEIGVNIEGLSSKGLSEFNLGDYHLLINLSGYSLQQILSPEAHHRLIQKIVPDPYGGSLEDYRHSLAVIKELIVEEICGDIHLIPIAP